MILILGGTIEGRIAVRTLEKAGKLYYYCTKEDEPKITMRHGIHLKGVMDEVELKRFCYKYNIKMLIDATHPFAEQMHQAVSNVTEKLRIYAIRFERFYPPRDKENITCCYFRILDRDSSRHLAARAGFSKKNLYYYHKGEDERLLMHQLHPEAILIKESGSSGGFSQKVEAALQEGIRIFAICRPPLPLPNSYLFVNGELSLRRKVEECLPDFYPIHSGLTTGCCPTVNSQFCSLAKMEKIIS